MLGRIIFALAAILMPAALNAQGVVADGPVDTGPRPTAQLLITNDKDGGHTIATLDQQHADEESAIESVGKLADGNDQQQGAQFWRWVNGDNGPTTFEGLWALHLTRYSQDNTPLVLLARNSIIQCAGATSGQPWQGAALPPTSWVETRCPHKIDQYALIGQDLTYDRHLATSLTVQDRAEIGTVSDGYIDKALQIGYSPGAGAAYFQGYQYSTSTFIPLIVAASDLTLGYNGQKVGFMGAVPIARPTVYGSRSAQNWQLSLLAALVNLGLVTDATTP